MTAGFTLLEILAAAALLAMASIAAATALRIAARCRGERSAPAIPLPDPDRLSSRQRERGVLAVDVAGDAAEAVGAQATRWVEVQGDGARVLLRLTVAEPP